MRVPTLVGVGLAIGFGVPYTIALDRMVRERFAELVFAEPSRVYARPLRLAPRVALTADALTRELAAARYRAVDAPLQPGTYRAQGGRFEIATRAFVGATGAQPARRMVLTISNGRIATLTDAATKAKLDQAFLDPARIATLYGPRQVERRAIRAADAPPLLVHTLQAVEDRDFKHHHGISLLAIARAAWKNLVAGEVVQGGSTLTQQLVRNLFLHRGQTWARKLNEAALALIIEARFSKQQILEAYLNEVYLGQQGAQAVHGVAAACEFYFGHDLQSLSATETALLVGLIQGPSLYDPRRFPERALQRRNIVLGVMRETGLISATASAAAVRQPLVVTPAGALPRNRHPAFLDVVRAEIAREFPDSRLSTEGLTILTTLAPSTQAYAEAAVAERLKALGKAGAPLEAAAVVTQSASGAIEAVIGGRDADEPGFNRALHAARPIGSLVKPFVYLVALAQPEQWSLMSMLSDRAITVRLSNGTSWSPSNFDGAQHGEVAMIDALARSYNLATVRLGLDVGVGKVARVLEALIPGARVEPNPSLLLGATDLSPLQVAQAYQYLAADGRPMSLYAVEAVLDARGRAVSRHAETPNPGELVAAARLVSFALQETASRGTAHALVGLGLGHLRVAGKTGTSNDQRDSWFAGYTGSHLAVVWLGTDDNRQTGLSGSTGALRVWAGLFAKLPSAELTLPLVDDPQLAWVDPQSQQLTDETCPGARRLPFIRGHEPYRYDGCPWHRVGDFFGRDEREDDERRSGRYGRYENEDDDEEERPRRRRWWQRDRDEDDDDDDVL
jgi:penicillin-binding protein 1B